MKRFLLPLLLCLFACPVFAQTQGQQAQKDLSDQLKVDATTGFNSMTPSKQGALNTKAYALSLRPDCVVQQNLDDGDEAIVDGDLDITWGDQDKGTADGYYGTAIAEHNVGFAHWQIGEYGTAADHYYAACQAFQMSIWYYNYAQEHYSDADSNFENAACQYYDGQEEPE